MNDIKKAIRAGVCVDYFNSERESLLDIILMRRLNIEKILAL